MRKSIGAGADVKNISVCALLFFGFKAERAFHILPLLIVLPFISSACAAHSRKRKSEPQTHSPTSHTQREKSKKFAQTHLMELFDLSLAHTNVSLFDEREAIDAIAFALYFDKIHQTTR